MLYPARKCPFGLSRGLSFAAAQDGDAVVFPGGKLQGGGSRAHEPHRPPHGAFVALKMCDAFLQFVTLGAVAVENALPQERQVFVVLAHRGN